MLTRRSPGAVSFGTAILMVLGFREPSPSTARAGRNFWRQSRSPGAPRRAGGAPARKKRDVADASEMPSDRAMSIQDRTARGLRAKVWIGALAFALNACGNGGTGGVGGTGAASTGETERRNVGHRTGRRHDRRRHVQRWNGRQHRIRRVPKRAPHRPRRAADGRQRRRLRLPDPQVDRQVRRARRDDLQGDHLRRVALRRDRRSPARTCPAARRRGWTAAESGCFGLMQIVPACGGAPGQRRPPRRTGTPT